MAKPNKPSKTAKPAEAKAPPPHSRSEDGGFVPQRRRVVVRTEGEAGKNDEPEVVGMNEDRKSVYDEFRASQEGTSPEHKEEAEASPEEEAPEETKKETPEAETKEKEPLGEPAVKGEDDPESKPEDKGKRTVPHEALHEEREKHKLTRAERDTLKSEMAKLQEQNGTYLKSLQELTNKVDSLVAGGASKKEETPEPIDDLEGTVRELRKQVKELGGKVTATETRSAEDNRKQMIQDLNGKIDRTNTDLEKEGFIGFKEFLPHVTDELKTEIGGDASKLQVLDTPENWKRIYKEKVFPKMKGLFVKEEKKAKIEEKKAAKQEAGLIGEAGGGGKSEKSEKKEWTHAEWLEWQQKRRTA